MGLVEVAMPAITSHLGTLGANRFSSVIPPAYCHSCMGEGVCAEAARAPPTRTAASTHGANSFRNSNAPPPKSTAEEHGRFPARHPGPLRGDHEFPARELAFGLRQAHRHLQRKHPLAIEVLVQAVAIVRAVLQQEWRRFHLSGGVAALEESRE